MLKIIHFFIFLVLPIHGQSETTKQNPEKIEYLITEFKPTVPAPTVLISHGGGCITASESAWAKRIVDWGFNAVVIDHCSARGIGSHTGIDPPTLKVNERVADYVSVAQWLQLQSWHKGKIALIGFSRGGEGVMRASDPRFNRNHDEGLSLISSYVSFYSPCTSSPAKKSRGPVLLHHGDLDNLAVFAVCEYPSWNNSSIRINIYKGVFHGFDVPGATLSGSNKNLGTFIIRKYDADADLKSQKITRDFLTETLR